MTAPQPAVAPAADQRLHRAAELIFFLIGSGVLCFVAFKRDLVTCPTGVVQPFPWASLIVGLVFVVPMMFGRAFARSIIGGLVGRFTRAVPQTGDSA